MIPIPQTPVTILLLLLGLLVFPPDRASLLTWALSSGQIKRFCSERNKVNVVGGSHNRLVTEGGRVSLTCCMPGRTTGHDHEQLTWFAPNGKELANHFSNPTSRMEHSAYSVPDFRSSTHLVTILVIQPFQMDDAGAYTCRKAQFDVNEQPAVVILRPRPRLLADYVPLTPSGVEESGSAAVAGKPVFIPLEEGLQDEIQCRVNPSLPLDDVHVTWYFQGRQLIAPASLMSGDEGRTPASERTASPIEMELAELTKQRQLLAASRQYGQTQSRSVSIDPGELGIRLLDRGQKLQIRQVDNRHAGVYLCKAEANNPTWTPETSTYDPPSDQSGIVESPILVQFQAIRGIVFSPPRILPGSPSEISPPLPGLGQRRKRANAPTPALRMSPNSRYYMNPAAREFERADTTPLMIDSPYLNRQKRPVAQEGGQMVLECKARGKPNARLLWYRGGMGVSNPTPGLSPVTATFDQRIKETLQHLPLHEVQRELGVLIADDQHLLPAINSVEMGSQPISNPHGDSNAERVTDNLGRFELSVSVKSDDTGEPVITVSQLTIDRLMPADATRYTCLAVLDLGQFGGSGNYTDVGSVFPEVVLRPRFISSGTQLQASGYPGGNATLTCEAFGGLSNPRGLRVRLLRGQGVPQLIKLFAADYEQGTSGSGDSAEKELAGLNPARSAMLFEPGNPNYDTAQVPENAFDASVGSMKYRYDEGTNDSIEIVGQNLNPRYQMTIGPDVRNPYMTILRLHVTNLQPEDNAYYACEALAGPHWRALAPPAQLGSGRMTVWFAPQTVITRPLEDADLQDREPTTDHVVIYGLSHLPSKLICRARGQPPPTWVWTGPQTGLEVPLDASANGYEQVDSQDGEFSVSELTVPAGYWNVGVFGTYSCTASNRLGSATGYLRLKLATHPNRPSMRACKVEAKMIELCVDPPKETGGLPLTHYELRIQTHPRGAFYGPFAYLPGRRLLRLPHLIPGYYYRFALSAVSGAGRGPNAYLQVTTNRLSKPAVKMLTAQQYIEPTAYTVHWKTTDRRLNDPSNVEQYKINIRPVEVDYAMGEVTGRPIGEWTEYAVTQPTCTPSDSAAEGVGAQMSTVVCQYRVGQLKSDTAYELELSNRKTNGLAEAQRILFRTSTVSGSSGQMLNTPSYLRQASTSFAKRHIIEKTLMVIIFIPLLFLLDFYPSSF